MKYRIPFSSKSIDYTEEEILVIKDAITNLKYFNDGK